MLRISYFVILRFSKGRTVRAYSFTQRPMIRPAFDCHFHTTRSDGFYTPEMAVAEAKKRGLEFAACTNHDLIDREIVRQFRDEGIESVAAVEISACDYGNGKDVKDKSFHVTAYSHAFDADFDAQLSGVRSTRVLKVRGQCEILARLGFDIDPASLEAYWRDCGLSVENLSNAHIRDYLFFSKSEERNRKNAREYRKLTGRDVDYAKFIKLHLGKTSEEPLGYFEIPRYEPGYGTLASVRGRCSAILSIAHPNHSFDREGIGEFERRAVRAIEAGAANALEIHSSTPPEWIEKVLEIRRRYDLVLTFGSDCHFKEEPDGKHAWLGELNPHLDDAFVAAEYARFRRALDA